MNSPHLSIEAEVPPPVPKGKLRLYSNRFCPYAQRVVLVLDAKKLSYEVVNINLVRKPDWFFDKSPLGKVPALELDTGDVLYESQIIAEYLDEKYPHNRLHSRDPLRKAKDQLLLRQFTLVINAFLKSINDGNVDDNEARIVADGLSAFDRELGERRGQFFGGNKPGMVDYMIWPWCERSDMLKCFGKQFVLKKDKYKRLMEWKDIMKEDDVVKISCLDPNIHLKFLQSFKTGTPNYDILLY